MIGNVRWRLAHWIVGQSIIPDPTNGEDRVSIVLRSEGLLMVLQAETFEANFETRLLPRRFPDDPAYGGRDGSTQTFHGTLR